MTVHFLKVLPVALFLVGLAVPSLASNCVTGSCHAKQVGYKFLHGPVAQEQLTGTGCESCHMPTAKACTATAKGVFKFADEKDKLCTMCHEKSDSPDHVGRVNNCIKCHVPHGSDKNGKHLKF